MSKDRILLERTLRYLFKRVAYYDQNHQNNPLSLGTLLFGVNGERHKRMVEVGYSVIYTASLEYISPIRFIDKMFKQGNDPQGIVLMIRNMEQERLLRGCSREFISKNSKYLQESGQIPQI